MSNDDEEMTTVATLVLSVEPGAGVPADVLLKAWNADEQLSALGWAERPSKFGASYFDASLMDVVMIPLAVNIASSIAYDLALKLIVKVRGKRLPDVRIQQSEITVNAQQALIVQVISREENEG